MCAKITQIHETKEGRVKNTLEKGKNAYLSIVRLYPNNHAPIPQTTVCLYAKIKCQLLKKFRKYDYGTFWTAR